ncbi:MAG: DUF1835 domain-containing protein [Ignavibacteria bacterium]
MIKFHILNGDCLYSHLSETSIQGEYIICRECLIEGDLRGENFMEFMNYRAEYISQTYGTAKDDYFLKTVSEFEKIINLPIECEVNLWFENDLFCQTNMWFIINLISERNSGNVVNRIFPVIKDKNDVWKGFGNSDSYDLELAFSNKIKFNEEDINLGNELWKAYKNGDNKKLTEISNSTEDSKCFHHLKEVCKANADKAYRTEKTIKEILNNENSDFKNLFSEFCKREGIYGYGDLQVKRIYDKVMAVVHKKFKI